MTHLNFGDYDNKTHFYGYWVEGKFPWKQTCLFLNTMQCCRTKRKPYFVFHDDKLNKINPITRLKQILKNKSILMIGDSIMYEFYEGIRELLKINGTTHNLKFILTWTISIKGSIPDLPVPTSVTEKTLTELITKYDVIIFNQGLHYINGPICQIVIHFNTWGSFYTS